MSLVGASKIASSTIAFNTRFARALDAIDDPIKALAMDIPSTHPTETYSFLDAVPGLTEWIDLRKLSKRAIQAQSIVNKDWANGIRMSRNDLLDDKLALLGVQVDELARKAALFMGNRLIEALVGGFTTTSEFGLAYDGLAFFSAAHLDAPGGTTQSNLSSSAPLTQAAYDAARATMYSLVDATGDALGIVPNTLIVGPTLERTALEITSAGVIPGPSAESIDNVFRGTATVIVSPRLIGAQASHWFLCDLSRAIKPMIMQTREPISTAMIPASGSPADLSGSERMFMQKDMLFGSQMRGNVGFGLWQFVHGSDD